MYLLKVLLEEIFEAKYPKDLIMFNFSQIPPKKFLQHIKSIIEIRKKLKKIIWKLRRLEKLKKLPRFDTNYWDWKLREPWDTKDIVF